MTMAHNDLTLAIAGTLAGAFLLGWLARWAFARLNAGASVAQVSRLTERLAEAEAARERAERRLGEAQAYHARRMSETEAESVPPARPGPAPRPRRRKSAPPRASATRRWQADAALSARPS